MADQRIDDIIARQDRHEAGCDRRHELIMAKLDEGSRRFRRIELVGAALAGLILAGEYGLAELIQALP